MSLEKTLDSVKMNSFVVEIFGLGYVGFPLAVKLASSGFNVIGIDVNSKRLQRLQENDLMDSESSLQEQYLESKNSGALTISEFSKESKLPRIGIICVPTPTPNEDRKSDVFVKSAVEAFLATSKPGDLLILESSIEVGTTENIQLLIEAKGYNVGNNFGLCFCPERIDPANKEWGLENIPRVIYCSDDQSFQISKEIYTNVNKANLIRVNSPRIAEVVKSFENAFRLVNISLVNELAILCDKLEINVKEVIDTAATKPFGFLPHYPGAGAGGHCIPKDPRFLLESAKKFDGNFAAIENALAINLKMPKYVSDSIKKSIEKAGLNNSVLVCGLSYKANVEDMRDSASFKIINELYAKGFDVYAYDPFFKNDEIEKYLIENNLEETNFKLVDNLDDSVLRNVSCICIVQHHDISKERIDEIYNESKVPLIYDCQNKIKKDPESKTVLDCLGS